MITFPKLLITNYHTLPYFKENFVFASDLKLKEVLTLLNGGKFLLVGYFDDIPVVAYETWHDDDHFIIYIEDAIMTDDQIASEKTYPDSNPEWDKYLKLH